MTRTLVSVGIVFVSSQTMAAEPAIKGVRLFDQHRSVGGGSGYRCVRIEEFDELDDLTVTESEHICLR